MMCGPRAAATGVLVVALLSGCAQVKDAAGGVASQAGQAAADQVRSQVCATVQKGQLNSQDLQLLAGLAATAKAAGLPAQFTDPLDQLAQTGNQASANSVTELQKACAASPTPSSSG